MKALSFHSATQVAKHLYVAHSLSVRRGCLSILLLLLSVLSLGGCEAVPVRTEPMQRPTATSSADGQPFIEISPSSGQGGTYLEIRGQGWPANTLVLVALSDPMGRSGILAAANTDPEGSVTTGFLYPISQRWSATGRRMVVAYTADGSLQATAMFTSIVPGTELTPIPEPQIGEVATETTPPSELSPTASQTSIPTETATSPVITTPTPSPTPTPAPTQIAVQDWLGEYWDNTTLSGSPVLVRDDPAIFFDWGWGSPDPSIPLDFFSARWTRVLNFEEATYRFWIEVDDGVRLYLDGILVLDEWAINSGRLLSADYSLSAGPHTVQIEYFEHSGQSLMRFWWEKIH